jgi:hypothetical protein
MGGEGVAAKILNKQSGTDDKGLGKGLKTPHRKKKACYEMLTQGLGSEWVVVNTVMNLRVP